VGAQAAGPPARRFSGESAALPGPRRPVGGQGALRRAGRSSGEQPTLPGAGGSAAERVTARRADPWSGEESALPGRRGWPADEGGDAGPWSGAQAAVRPAGRRSAAEPPGSPGRRRSLGAGAPPAVGPDPYADDHASVFTDPRATVPLAALADVGDLDGPDETMSARWPAGTAYGGDTYADESYSDDTYDEDYDDDFGGDDVEELPKRRGCRNAVVVLGVLVLMAIVAGWFAWSWVSDRIDPPGAQGEEVLVEIPEGTSTAGIGDVLAEAGVISDASVWNWYTKLRDVPSIQAGKYRMRLNSSFSEAIEALEDDPLPPEVDRLVTIPEGLTQAQLAERLADPEDGVPGFTAEGVQQALADPASRSSVLPADQRSLEGTLFPETYAVEEGDTEAAVVQRMVAQFDEVAAEVDLAGRAAQLGYSPYEVLIVASMVEREAGIPEDGPRIARVIYNRLAAGEALGIDATSCYEKGEIPCELTTEELEDDSPYDTRYRTGLTPTPIASPGQASIEAALAPADGDWRWYVLDAEANDGSSFFTNDYDEFLAAKQRCADAGLGCG
jgi:UPF0755 protein